MSERYNLAMLRKFASRPDWQIAAITTVTLRVFYSALAAAFSPFVHLDPRLIRSNELTDNLPVSHGLYYAWLGIWHRFDTMWFLRIAQHGYDSPMAVIFYPLYPALIRQFSVVLPALAAALLVSTLAAFFVFWGLLRLAAPLTEMERLCTLLLFCDWPASFILFAGYSDSLTIALVIWAIVFAREAQWVAATVCGVLGGAARPTGVLVFVPLAIMAWRSRQVRSWMVAFTPIGMASYWAWLRWSGRPSVVEAYRQYQHMTMAAPWTGLTNTVHLIWSQHDELLALKLGLVALVAFLALHRQQRADIEKTVRFEDKAFALVAILQMLMYTGRPLLGAARYVLMLYPAFLVLGAHADRWRCHRLIFCAMVLGSVNLVWMWGFMNWSLVL